jgi:hypothetical protein
MTNDARRIPPAERRAALIAQCARQRLDAAHEIRSLLPHAGEGHSIGGRLKLPLMIAGVVLGIIATRSGRAMPMLTAGLGLWKMVSRVLPMLRLLRSRS